MKRTVPPLAFERDYRPVKLAIIGGGAAGMFAAAVAAERHIPCVVIERKARLGSKVLMTANGRCNFAKDISPDQFLRDLGEGSCAEFVAEAVRECPPRQICRGFQSLGVRTKRMTDGRLFPADEKATTIVHAFGDLLRDKKFRFSRTARSRRSNRSRTASSSRQRTSRYGRRMCLSQQAA